MNAPSFLRSVDEAADSEPARSIRFKWEIWVGLVSAAETEDLERDSIVCVND
jgi:hypothetical protein